MSALSQRQVGAQQVSQGSLEKSILYVTRAGKQIEYAVFNIHFLSSLYIGMVIYPTEQ